MKLYLAISYKYIEHFYEISFKIRPFEAIFLSKVLLTQDPSAVLGCFKLLNPVSDLKASKCLKKKNECYSESLVLTK